MSPHLSEEYLCDLASDLESRKNCIHWFQEAGPHQDIPLIDFVTRQ